MIIFFSFYLIALDSKISIESKKNHKKREMFMYKTKKIRYSSLFFIALSIHSFAQKDEKMPKPAVTDEQFDETVFDWTRTWAEIMQLVKQKHYKITEPEVCMARALDAFLNCLDPHSNFLEPKTYTAMLETTSGEFHGIGIVIDNTRKSRDRSLTIVEIVPDGPAEKAGLQQYDKIVEIDGHLLEGLTTEEAIKLIKGEKGTKTALKIIREGQQDLISIEVTRDIVKAQSSLSFYIKNQNIYYLSLTTFSENSVKQIETLLKKAETENYRGIILDLRNNSGGLLNAVVTIAGFFLPKGSLVTFTKNKQGKVIEEYRTKRPPLANAKTPIFVLTNNYTASAAEILAGCLKIHAGKKKHHNTRIFLVGGQTFGKGSVQEVIPVSNNSAISLTTALYFLPDGSTIQGTGIEPDFVIERYMPPTEQSKWFMQSYGRECTLDRYIQAIGEQKHNEDKKEPETKQTVKTASDIRKPKTWLDRARDMLLHDNQLQETITLINILNTANTHFPKQVRSRKKALAYLKDHYVRADKLEIEEVKG